MSVLKRVCSANVRSAAVEWHAGLLSLAMGAGLALANAAHAQTITYTYDAQGRLASAATTGGHTVTYTYDANGNRTQKVITGGTGGNTAPVANGDIIDAESYFSTSYPTAAFNPTANDSDAEWHTLTITSVTQPNNGTVTFSSNWVTYTHGTKHGADGMQDIVDFDSFTYTISDGNGGSSIGTVDVNIVIW